jgi:RimJ/RimL family protein N-acetyltransferase
MNTFPPITIRQVEESDADAVLAAVRESYAEVSPWMVWCTADYSMEDALKWIRATGEARAAGSACEFLVFDSSGALAGVCGINHVNSIDRFANLGYWIRTSRTGRGIAPAAVLAVAEWAFANTPLNRLEIVAALGNTRSQRVAEKVGALREGILRSRLVVGGVPVDAVMYSLVRPPL